MKFDIVLANPPYNGKTNIQYKMIGIAGEFSTDSSIHAYVVPVNMFVRKSERAQKHTAWLDKCDMVWEKDATDYFPTVSENITAFIVDRATSGNFISRDIKCPINFPAKRVVGIDFGNTKKTKSEEYCHPIFCCVSVDGTPSFHRFTNDTGLNKLKSYSGKPVVHVNLHGGMIKFDTIAWVDTNGEHGWFRQGIDSFVFDDKNKAIEAAAWLNGEFGKKYIDECLNAGWLLRPQIQEIFKS